MSTAESQIMVGYIGLAVFLLFVAAGVRIGFAALIVGAAGLWVEAGLEPAFRSIGSAAFGITGNYTLSVIPLFVLMGYFAHYAGFADDLFDTARKWVGNLPGGLLVATVLGGAGFAAVCGSSVASAAILTNTCLPELEKNKYDTRLSIGCLAATGTIAIMIPPSLTMVIFSIMVEQNVSKLLIAGILPGIITAVYYTIYIVVRARMNPSIAPGIPGVTWKARLSSVALVWPVVLVAAIIMGGLYSGFFTATEAAAIGATVILLAALARKRLRWDKIRESLRKTLETTCMIMIITFGVLFFSRFLAYSQVTYSLSRYIVGLSVPPMVIMTFILALYFVLGMFMEPIGMMALTLPVVFPAVMALHFDPILFGILVIVESELSMLTPPVGLNLFVVSGVAPHVPFMDIVRGVVPFVIIECFMLATLLIFPQIALYLPSLMK